MSCWLARCLPGFSLRGQGCGNVYRKCGMSLEQNAAPGTRMLYTCPMHPQVEQDSPGNCPICGTALEPKNAGSEEENEELSDMTRRFWLSVALSAPMFILSMGHMLPAAPRWLESDVSRWIQFILSTPVGSGPGGRSSSAAGNRSVSVRLTCLPLSPSGSARRFSTARR